MDFHLLSQYLLSGLVIGVIYSLMALGITFIYSIMKMINWSMGEFYMIGSYVQYFLLASVLGWDRWYLALPLAMASVFLLGMVVQRFLLRPMYVGGVERRDEYATVMTIALMVLFRNLAIVLGGPNQYSPRDYAKPTMLPIMLNSPHRPVDHLHDRVDEVAVVSRRVGRQVEHAAAMSSTCPGRAMGILCSSIRRRNSLTPGLMAVSMVPGATTFTRMRSPTSSIAAARASALRPPLEAT